MLDLDANPRLRTLFRIARLRVSLGFLAAAAAFTFARPTWFGMGTGALIAFAGEAARVWAAGHLEKGREVTTSGPYRVTRHPLYAGSITVGLGFAVAGSTVAVAAVILGYLVVMVPVAIRLEEATLRASFPTEHTRYVRGDAPRSDRRFSLRRARCNGEHLAVLGVLGSLAIFGVKAWWDHGWP